MFSMEESATTEKAAVLCSQCRKALRETNIEIVEAGSSHDFSSSGVSGSEDFKKPRRRPGNANKTKEKSGPSQEDLRVYITMAVIILLAFVVTLVKVIVQMYML